MKFLGLVPDEDVSALYEGALALVMPSYCGPTNIPPLEAVTLGCPVIYSDLPEFREQMRDAALYCNLGDSSRLADQLEALIQAPELIAHLEKAGLRASCRNRKDRLRRTIGARFRQLRLCPSTLDLARDQQLTSMAKIARGQRPVHAPLASAYRKRACTGSHHVGRFAA